MLDFPNSPSANQVFTAAGASWLWDTVKWKAVIPTPPDTSVNVLTPASGATIALTDQRPVYINTAQLDALTIKLPAGMNYSALVQISFANPVLTLAMQDSAGNPVANGPTGAYGPGAAIEFQYSNVGWVYWK